LSINNQKSTTKNSQPTISRPDTAHVAQTMWGRAPSPVQRSRRREPCGTSPARKPYSVTTRRQYARRGSVAVARAAQPCFRSLRVACTAASREANNPYRVEPEPDSDAYFAPARKSALLPRLSSGYSGKTTSSKSFSIPARSSQRSGFSARPLLANNPEGALEHISLSHADNPRPSSPILSEAEDAVNFAVG
jgi:hypothetical protein